MDPQELLLTAIRGVGLYFIMLVVLRLLGKRSVGSFSAFDLLVALMLGEVADEIIYGDVSFLQGIIAILVISLLHFLTGFAAFASKRLDQILEGVPTVMMRDGEFDRTGMLKERINEDEILSHLREQGIDDTREVKLALLEPSGAFSVIKQEWAEPIQKSDLGGKEAEEKERTTEGMQEPPPSKSTVSRQALGKAA